MKIKIEQTLHGYSHGHQLLASSSSIPNEVKEILLVHSDLSGSNIDNGFKEYLSGYPLGNQYAFSKTWYAEEMKRPGCVWTHTLLIEFADLGKIPDLNQLTTFFVRPSDNLHLEYQIPLYIERADLMSSNEMLSKNKVFGQLMIGLYENFNSTILIPAENSALYEEIVLQIWSNQWPRLRRNFTFCTGALNIKILDGKEFDLQVVPARNVDIVSKKSSQPLVIKESDLPNTDWLEILYKAPKNDFRRFMWVYGSDVSGTRKYFKPLVLLYIESKKSHKSIANTINLIEDNFYGANEADLLKWKILSSDNIFSFDDSELLAYLLSTEDIPVANIERLDLQARLAKAFSTGKISFNTFLELYLSAQPNRISSSIWHAVELDESEILSLIANDYSLLDLFSSRILALSQDISIWHRPKELQIKIVDFLNKLDCDWRPIIFAALNAGSEVVGTMLSQDSNNRARFVFQWQDANNRSIWPDLENYIFRYFKGALVKHLKSNSNNFSTATCTQAFSYFNSSEIREMNLHSGLWIFIYNKIAEDRIKVYAACVLLSLALNKKVEAPVPLIPACFGDVFAFAKQALVNNDIWKIIPIDTSEEEDRDFNPFAVFFNFFTPKAIKEAQYWDYCELLIRTLANKFIKNHWPQQAYLDSMNSPEILIRSFEYCLSFKSGSKFMKQILDGINNRQLKVSKTQLNSINRVFN